MNIEPKNEVIEIKMLSIYREVFKFDLPDYNMTFNDQDNCRYKMEYVQSEDKFYFSFYSKYFDEIFNIDGKNMIATRFPDFKIDATKTGYNITLSLDCSPVDKPQENDNKATKNAIKQVEEDFFTKYSSQLAYFKRHLFASPFEKIFNLGKEGKLSLDNKVEFAFSDDSICWIIPEGDQIGVFFAINFENKTEKTIAKLILTEMEVAKKHVQNPPSVMKTLDDKIPDILAKNFNSERVKAKYSNGIIAFTLFKRHYAENLERSATMFSQFRQYLKYHIHASMTYLHGRMRRRVGQLQKTNNQAKFEEEGKKTYRSLKGKNVEVNVGGEEEKGPKSLLKK